MLCFKARLTRTAGSFTPRFGQHIPSPLLVAALVFASCVADSVSIVVCSLVLPRHFFPSEKSPKKKAFGCWKRKTKCSSTRASHVLVACIFADAAAPFQVVLLRSAQQLWHVCSFCLSCQVERFRSAQNHKMVSTHPVSVRCINSAKN